MKQASPCLEAGRREFDPFEPCENPKKNFHTRLEPLKNFLMPHSDYNALQRVAFRERRHHTLIFPSFMVLVGLKTSSLNLL